MVSHTILEMRAELQRFRVLKDLIELEIVLGCTQNTLTYYNRFHESNTLPVSNLCIASFHA